MTDGTTPVPAADASIAFTWAGAGSLVTPSPCTTSAAGTCTVSVTSPSAGSGTLTVTGLTDSGGRAVDLTVAGAPGQAPGQVVPVTASKTWSQYRVLLSPSATNLTGSGAHVHGDGAAHRCGDPTEADWTAVPDGTTLTATTTGSGHARSGVDVSDPPGTNRWDVPVHRARRGAGHVDLNVTAIAATTVDGVPFTNIPLTAPAPATKTWVAYTVTISPSTTNPVGTQHNFTITATVTDGTTTIPAAGASIAFTWTGTGSLVTPSPCTTARRERAR